MRWILLSSFHPFKHEDLFRVRLLFLLSGLAQSVNERMKSIFGKICVFFTNLVDFFACKHLCITCANTFAHPLFVLVNISILDCMRLQWRKLRLFFSLYLRQFPTEGLISRWRFARVVKTILHCVSSVWREMTRKNLKWSLPCCAVCDKCMLKELQ